jgi:hypothetical protein
MKGNCNSLVPNYKLNALYESCFDTNDVCQYKHRKVCRG